MGREPRVEVGGVPIPPRADVSAPQHWRWEQIAATERARSLAVSPDGQSLAFIHDRDTSDLWTVSTSGTIRRLTAGRQPAPFWEDTALAWSPNGDVLAYGDDGWVTTVAVGGAIPTRLCEGSGPEWISDDELVVTIERDRRSVLARVQVADPWPTPLVDNPLGDAFAPVLHRATSQMAYTVWRFDAPHSEIWVLGPDGTDRLITELPGLLDGGPVFSPDGSTIAYTAQSDEWTHVWLAAADGSTPPRQLTNAEAELAALAWHPSGDRLVCTQGRDGRSHLSVIEVASGAITELATGGWWGEPAWQDDAVVATYEDHRTPPRVERVWLDGTRTVLIEPTPAAVLSAPHISPTDFHYTSPDGRPIHGFLYRPNGTGPFPAVVHVHGGPASVSGDEWDGMAQYFVAAGFAWLSINVRGSTTYGRTHERANYGDWGGGDVTDVLAAHTALADLPWIDPARVAVFGPSYGSYMALCAVAMDAQHRFAGAICKYGDCDILTSWSQGDRSGVMEQERMLGKPTGANRITYERGSPYHHLHQVQVPILIAHGDQDLRVSPKQSEQLVARLRDLGKRYEYVAYPTEAHGFLRTEPFLDFVTRMERFLHWVLL